MRAGRQGVRQTRTQTDRPTLETRIGRSRLLILLILILVTNTYTNTRITDRQIAPIGLNPAITFECPYKHTHTHAHTRTHTHTHAHTRTHTHTHAHTRTHTHTHTHTRTLTQAEWVGGDVAYAAIASQGGLVDCRLASCEAKDTR
jgi:ABC-type nickel/cobalt efflux system permease component RcnA